jgi:hypothetical protein
LAPRRPQSQPVDGQRDGGREVSRRQRLPWRGCASRVTAREQPFASRESIGHRRSSTRAAHRRPRRDGVRNRVDRSQESARTSQNSSPASDDVERVAASDHGRHGGESIRSAGVSAPASAARSARGAAGASVEADPMRGTAGRPDPDRPGALLHHPSPSNWPLPEALARVPTGEPLDVDER